MMQLEVQQNIRMCYLLPLLCKSGNVGQTHMFATFAQKWQTCFRDCCVQIFATNTY